jgi:outer membrane protein OmpA-like peptidoglycan-associated protein
MAIVSVRWRTYSARAAAQARPIGAISLRHGERRVQIDGFTDSMVTDLYNQDLSQRRADAVKASSM